MRNPDLGYPDISDILARKASGRRQRAALSFAQKLVILDTLRERVAPLAQARKSRGNDKLSVHRKGELVR